MTRERAAPAPDVRTGNVKASRTSWLDDRRGFESRHRAPSRPGPWCDMAYELAASARPSRGANRTSECPTPPRWSRPRAPCRSRHAYALGQRERDRRLEIDGSPADVDWIGQNVLELRNGAASPLTLTTSGSTVTDGESIAERGSPTICGTTGSVRLASSLGNRDPHPGAGRIHLDAGHLVAVQVDRHEVDVAVDVEGACVDRHACHDRRDDVDPGAGAGSVTVDGSTSGGTDAHPVRARLPTLDRDRHLRSCSWDRAGPAPRAAGSRRSGCAGSSAMSVDRHGDRRSAGLRLDVRQVNRGAERIVGPSTPTSSGARSEPR